MTIHIEGEMTVRELVGRYPQTRPVFEKHGIDYCCGGAKSLTKVATEHDQRLPELVDALGQLSWSICKSSEDLIFVASKASNLGRT